MLFAPTHLLQLCQPAKRGMLSLNVPTANGDCVAGSPCRHIGVVNNSRRWRRRLLSVLLVSGLFFLRGLLFLRLRLCRGIFLGLFLFGCLFLLLGFCCRSLLLFLFLRCFLLLCLRRRRILLGLLFLRRFRRRLCSLFLLLLLGLGFLLCLGLCGLLLLLLLLLLRLYLGVVSGGWRGRGGRCRLWWGRAGRCRLRGRGARCSGGRRTWRRRARRCSCGL